MRTTAFIFAAVFLSGCAGLQTQWVWQARIIYETPQDKPAPAPVNPGAPL
jgi:hypothetical protein